MKQIILSLALFIYVILSFVQTTKSQAISKDAFLKKSKTQNTIGWIVLGGGTACFLGCGKLFIDSYGPFGKTNFWDYVFITGFVTEFASIPFF